MACMVLLMVCSSPRVWLSTVKWEAAQDGPNVDIETTFAKALLLENLFGDAHSSLRSVSSPLCCNQVRIAAAMGRTGIQPVQCIYMCGSLVCVRVWFSSVCTCVVL